MKKLFKFTLAGVLLALLLAGCLQSPLEDGPGFYAQDDRGHILKSHWSQRDGVWYLFVPSTQPLEALAVEAVDGILTHTSTGVLEEATGRVTGGFSQSGDRLTLTDDRGQTHTLVALQSSLPSVYIDLAATTLTQIHADKDAKHPGNSFYLSDPEGRWDLVCGDVELKGRGNSSWEAFDKKSYQLKFQWDISLMGMEPARKWVLLSNSGDDSLMRTQLVSQAVADWPMAFAASFRYVDLWVEGEYLGTYLLGEKVELGQSRLPLTHAAGAIFEHDEAFYQGEDYWFLNETINRHFALKEIVKEELPVVQSASLCFNEALSRLATYLYTTPSAQVTLEALSAMVDVDSVALYYLINEYTLNRESFSTSFYWYQDGPEDVLHMGPVWDFDSCMGIDGMGSDVTHGHLHPIFHYLLAAPAFRERTVALMETYGQSLLAMAGQVDVLLPQLEASADMNDRRWEELGSTNPKGGPDFAPSYAQAVENLRSWLEQRAQVFQVAQTSATTSLVSPDCATIDMYFHGRPDADKVMFSLWSMVDGKDDMDWYPATQISPGVWHAQADLSNHNSAGIYYLDAYTQEQTVLEASGRTYVAQALEPRYPMELILEGETLTLTLTDRPGQAQAVRFALWGMADRAGTMIWQVAEEVGDGVWQAQVGLQALGLKETDIVVAHAYDQADTLLNTAELADVPAVEAWYLMEVTAQADVLTLTLTDRTGQMEAVRFALWGMADQASTLIWQDAQAVGDGVWQTQVPLCALQLPQADTLVVHGYGIQGQEDHWLKEATLDVQPAAHEPEQGVCTRCGKPAG